MKYVAVMFDIVESRHYQGRLDIQKSIIQSIAYLNDLYGESIKKEMVPSAGDEFQGLFLDLQTAYLYVRKLQILIYPVKIRCGIGFGEIKYDVSEWLSSAFDGDAYYLARDAINAAREQRKNTICFNTNSKTDKYLNMLCLANIEVKARQTQMAHWIELLTDILLPLRQVEEKIEFYKDLLDWKIKTIEQERWNRVSGHFREIELKNTDFDLLFKTKENIEMKDNESDLFFDDFWSFGMNTNIAQIMNTSRQNIDRYVSLGRIKESRTMDKTIYELLGEKLC